MRKIVILLLVIAEITFCCIGKTAEEDALIMACRTNSILFPFEEYQAVEMQYDHLENEVELIVLDTGGVRKSIRVPCERENISFVVSASNNPEFMIYEPTDDTLTRYEWKEDGLYPLQKWKGDCSWIAKPEGIMLVNREKESIEFIDSQNAMWKYSSSDLNNYYFDDVIWEEDGWLLLARGASVGNLRSVWKLDVYGNVIWKCEFPEVKEAEGIYSDGSGGLWLPYSPFYAGDMSIFHVNAEGVPSRTVVLGGASRVKSIYCGRTTNKGNAILYGVSLAHSKSIYHVFALTLSSEGSVLGLEVRKFPYRKDYGITLKSSGDGVVYVCSETDSEILPLLVPFDSLPIENKHGLLVNGL